LYLRVGEDVGVCGGFGGWGFVYMVCIYVVYIWRSGWLVKVFRGFRFDDVVYDGFCSLASKKGYTATAALERYMGDCVGLDMLFFAERRVEGFEAEARVLVDWLGKGKLFYRGADGEELNVSGRLLWLLPRVGPGLAVEVEAALKASVKKEDRLA
jgi:hypothetical protein